MRNGRPPLRDTRSPSAERVVFVDAHIYINTQIPASNKYIFIRTYRRPTLRAPRVGAAADNRHTAIQIHVYKHTGRPLCECPEQVPWKVQRARRIALELARPSQHLGGGAERWPEL